MTEFKHQALNLLRAEEDLYFARSLSKDPGAKRRGVGFNAQQAAEKALKAALMFHEVRYPFTHDITALMKLVAQAGLVPPGNADYLDRLTPFATFLRYEDEATDVPEPRLSVQEMLSYAETTVIWARSILQVRTDL